jgi:hypothetical protein
MANQPKGGRSMVVRCARVTLAVTAVVALTTRPALAQQNTERPFTFGAAAGLARASNETGFHAAATIDLRTPVSALRLRAEGLYANWGGVGVNRFSSILASAVVSPFPHAKVSPYAIAGAGGYANFGDGMRAGWSLGLGVRLPTATHLLVESRVHAFTWNGSDLPLGHPAYTTSDKWKYVWLPLGFGIRF